MITITNRATDEKLTTLDDVKAVMGVTSTADDLTLEKFITRASARISAYCGRPFAVQAYESVQPGLGRTILQLPHAPLRAVLAVYEGTDATEALSATEYRVDYQTGQLHRDRGWPWSYQLNQSDLSFEPIPGAEYQPYRVLYSAGYILAGGKDSGSTWDGTTSTGRTLPEDVGDACIALVRRNWLHRQRDPNVISERVGELSVSYKSDDGGGGGSSMPLDVADLLAPYRSYI